MTTTDRFLDVPVNRFLGLRLRSHDDLVARAKLVRRGRRVGVCRVDVEQDGRAVAFGVFTYMFFERE